MTPLGNRQTNTPVTLAKNQVLSPESCICIFKFAYCPTSKATGV